MDVRLVVEAGSKRKKTLRLRSEETIVGRRQDCDLKIKSAEVSRRHCVLTFQDGYLSVEDLDSVNGTFLNGARVTSKSPIRPGDRLEIGPLRFVIEYEITQEALGRLERDTDSDVATKGDLDVLPAVEEAAEVEELDALEIPEGDLDELPVLEEDTDFKFEKAADDDAAIPIAEDIEDGAWHLPQANDLRGLISGMDDPKAKKRKPDEE